MIRVEHPDEERPTIEREQDAVLDLLVRAQQVREKVNSAVNGT